MCSVRFDSLLSKSGRVIGTRLAYPSYGRDRCKMKRKRILLIVACVFLLGCGKKELSQEKVSEDNAVEKTEESVKQPEAEETQENETEVSSETEPIQAEEESKPEVKPQEEPKQEGTDNKSPNTTVPETPNGPVEESKPDVQPEVSQVAYNPQDVVRLATEKTKARGKVLLTENLDRLLSEGKITKEEYDAYYPYDGAGYYSVFVETDLKEARTTSGTLLNSVDGIAEYIAGMLALEPGPYFLIEYKGVYHLNGTDFYEFRCYRA